MAGSFYLAGEVKNRPGIYQRIVAGANAAAKAVSDGVAACVLTAEWGPLNVVQEVTSYARAESLFGTGGNVGLIRELFDGGARKVLAVRGGSGGAASSGTLKDGGSANAVTVTAKCVGARALKYLLRDVAGETDKREFVLTEGGRILERTRFSKSASGEVNALCAASSNYVTFAKVGGYAGTGKLADVVETALAGGVNPTVADSAYTNALEELKTRRWNALCVDSAATSVHALLAGFIERVYEDGRTGFAVVGEPGSVAFETRLAHAAAFNDFRVVYMGGGWTESDGTNKEGFLAAARVAGMIAGTPASQAVTHKRLAYAVAPVELLTGAQHDRAILSGMLTTGYAPSGEVWLDSGVTTRNLLAEGEDGGWKKIKRTKVRFEAMDRVGDAVAPLLGVASNNADGRAAILQAAQGVLTAMVGENKLQSGAIVYEDAETEAEADSAYFILEMQDVDALEKIYLAFHIGLREEA